MEQEKQLVTEKGEFSLLILDELFNSTDPLQGISAGHALCKDIAKLRGNICLLTTHYEYLTRLGRKRKRKNIN